MGYEPVCTSDSDEALRLIRLGRCRLVFASIHLETQDPFGFLARALRCDPGDSCDFDGRRIHTGGRS